MRDAGLARLWVTQVTHGFGTHCRHIRMPKASQVRFGIAIRLAKREKNQAVTTLSEQASQFDALLQRDEPMLALAPMQDVTDLPFWRVITKRGGADVYFTEYFRVHADSRLEKPILRSITENPTGRPVVAQMIGNSIPDLVRTARELQQHPIAGVDLNLGCPAPIVYKKCAGGGLLREPERIDRILGALRDAVETRFTVKTRIGFDDAVVFDERLQGRQLRWHFLRPVHRFE